MEPPDVGCYTAYSRARFAPHLRDGLICVREPQKAQEANRQDLGQERKAVDQEGDPTANHSCFRKIIDTHKTAEFRGLWPLYPCRAPTLELQVNLTEASAMPKQNVAVPSNFCLLDAKWNQFEVAEIYYKRKNDPTHENFPTLAPTGFLSHLLRRSLQARDGSRGFARGRSRIENWRYCAGFLTSRGGWEDVFAG